MHWIRGEVLGRGGFGFVYKAKTDHDSDLPQFVAVKTAKVLDLISLTKEKALLNEFKDCPFIIRCFGGDFSEENGEHYYNILLEYASGGCIMDRIKNMYNKGLPELIVRRYTKSILTALSHIHKLGYVHCDIKPHNILLVKEDGKEIAKLADFGIAKRYARGSFEEVQEDEIFKGTYIYAAPESIDHAEFVPQSDIWALGCTVLQMLTGESPWNFDKNEYTAVLLCRIAFSEEIPCINNKNLSENARDFLRKCLVKDPKARFTADMLIDHPFIKEATTKSSSSNHKHHQRMPSRFHVPSMAHYFNVGESIAC